MKSDKDQSLRQHLLYVLQDGGAHAGFDAVVGEFPAALREKKVPGLPYTPWMLLEHMRLAQWDILEFSRNRKHVSPAWPDGYWPRTSAPPSVSAWKKSLQSFKKDLKTMQALVKDPKTDLHARIPWGEGQTILREAILVADHNAYHLGQLVLLRRLLGAWKS